MLQTLTTPRGETLSGMPWQVYPRPQMRRDSYINLNGEWDFAVSSGNPETFDMRILVPFCPESRLSGIGRHFEEGAPLWYRRRFLLPEGFRRERVLLHIGAADQIAEVFVNGQHLCRHEGGYASFCVDITEALAEENELVIRCTDDLHDQAFPYGKQVMNRGGMWYTPVSGIWQTVWMEAVDDMALERVQVVTDIDNEQIVVIPTYYNVAGGNTLSVEVRDGGKVVAHAESAAVQGVPVVVALKKAKLWSPESPFLYDVVYEVKDAEGKTLDRVDAYVGMRKVHIDGNKIYLNNKPYYQRLVLDQGFYPDGIWTAPSDEALKHDIEMSKAAGFNGARLHQKVFEERFHYWADKLGYIVWGEMASWDKDFNSVAAARNFLSEWGNIVVRDRNHPALIVWTPFNEEFGVPSNEAGRFLTDVYNETRRLDPTRPVNTVSGGIYVISDFCTAHCYEQDGARLHSMLFDGEKFYQPQGPNGGFERAIRKLYYDGSLPYLLDEFGGIKCAETQPEGGNSWGYGDAAPTREDFYKRLEALVKAIVEHSDKICGFCYTQLTDVEQEQNGVYYYDRGEKFDMGRVKAIFQMKAEGYEQ